MKSQRTFCFSLSPRHVGRWALLVALACGLVIHSGRADTRTEQGPPTVARSLTEKGTVFLKSPVGGDWQVVAPNGTIPVGGLVVGLPGAEVTSADQAVVLQFEGNLEGKAPHPIIESAVRFTKAPNADMGFTLDRGWVAVVNHKEMGKATVQFKVLTHTWNVTLQSPGTRFAMILYGRWARGVPFSKQVDPRHSPTLSLVMAVIHGEVTVEASGVEHALTAPPGPAMLEWDSVGGQDASPIHLDKLPAWAVKSEQDTPEVKEKKAALEQLVHALGTRPVNEVLEEYIHSEDATKRRAAVYVMGALDKLHLLGQAMRETKHADVRDNGVLTLRHWIGRAPGQDQILYARLIQEGKYSPVQTQTILQLLHSFGEAQLARPETYQTLIDYLEHESAPIRGLAYWHLVRLVPEGREFGYDPTGTKEAREEAVAKWRKLIPEGKLPPSSRAKASTG